MSALEFKSPKEAPTSLTMLLYGDSGVGKTPFALSFPGVAIVDMDRGTNHYKPSDFNGYKRIQTVNPLDVVRVVDNLLENPRDFQTFVLDPVSVLWEAEVHRHLTKLRERKGDPEFMLKPLDYKVPRSRIVSLFLKFKELNSLNLVVTAKSKEKFKPRILQESNEDNILDGATYDGPSRIHYEFDIVIEAIRDEETDIVFAYTRRDRTRTLPIKWEFSFDNFAKYYGSENLKLPKTTINESNGLLRTVDIVYKDKQIKTAGIKASQLEAILEQKTVRKFSTEEFLDIVSELADGKTKLFDLNQEEGQVVLEGMFNK